MSQGFRTIYQNKQSATADRIKILVGHTGKRMCDPTTSESGMMSGQSYPGICHSNGTRLVENTIIMAMHAKQMMNDSLKRCQIRGTV
jgi:hypothetical protein